MLTGRSNKASMTFDVFSANTTGSLRIRRGVSGFNFTFSYLSLMKPVNLTLLKRQDIVHVLKKKKHTKIRPKCLISSVV